MSARVAVVTGGASGIGAATAKLLAAQGVTVAVLDLNSGIRTDVSDADSVSAAVAEVKDTFGSIDILVNAAGIAAGGPIEMDGYVEQWQRTFAINLTGMMLMVRACVGDLQRNCNGRIVNIASTEALAAGKMSSPYTTSKHGVVGFTRSMAVELGRRGVTVNAVCPGPTLTGMTQLIPEENRNTFGRRNVPVGRYGTADEIAYMVVALTALDASFVNGAVIAVDGGMTAQGR
jgi:3-oxoacyl-[acyl-carrier protein] reductase